MKIIDWLNIVLYYFKNIFVGKDEIIDLMGIVLVVWENLFMLGFFGIVKSVMVRFFVKLLDGKIFEYFLIWFIEFNEFFGFFDICKFWEGEFLINIEGMFFEVNLIFLDELFNVNSVILNSLLMVLNEWIFWRGKEIKDFLVLMIVGVSNYFLEDDVL